VLARLKPYQRVSQYPGITIISNKNKLAWGLMKMRKLFPEQYNFFPVTYVLPVEYNEFKS
jgi:tubulin polyglutamylase TTLL6/13